MTFWQLDYIFNIIMPFVYSNESLELVWIDQIQEPEEESFLHCKEGHEFIMLAADFCN